MNHSTVYLGMTLALCALASADAAPPPATPPITEQIKQPPRLTPPLQPAPKITAPPVALRGIFGEVRTESNNSLLSGFGVRVKVRAGGREVAARNLTLNNQSRASYHFPLGPGDYVLTVEKGPAPGGSHVNACFRGTAPASRSARLTADRPSATAQNFSINYVIAFGRTGSCW